MECVFLAPFLATFLNQRKKKHIEKMFDEKNLQVATTTANCTSLFCDLGGLPMAAMLTLAIFFGWNVTSPRRSLSQISAEVLKTEILWEIGRKKTTQNPIGYGAFAFSTSIVVAIATTMTSPPRPPWRFYIVFPSAWQWRWMNVWFMVRLMEEIPSNHLGCVKPYKKIE